MDKKDGHSRDQVGATGVRQSLRRGPDTKWDSACRDAKRRSELHSPQPASPRTKCKTSGFVYIMRDALGSIKVGCTADLPKRLFDMQHLVTNNRRPVVLVRAIEVPKSAMKRIEFRTFRLMRSCRISRVAEWFSTTAQVASRRLNEATRQVAAQWPSLLRW